jgi:hypothetical protein
MTDEKKKEIIKVEEKVSDCGCCCVPSMKSK